MLKLKNGSKQTKLLFSKGSGFGVHTLLWFLVIQQQHPFSPFQNKIDKGSYNSTYLNKNYQTKQPFAFCMDSPKNIKLKFMGQTNSESEWQNDPTVQIAGT